MSDTAFEWFLTLMVGVVAGVWVIFDVVNLVKLRGQDGSDAKIGDRRFGYMMGIVIGTLGVIGAVKHHLG